MTKKSKTANFGCEILIYFFNFWRIFDFRKKHPLELAHVNRHPKKNANFAKVMASRKSRKAAIFKTQFSRKKIRRGEFSPSKVEILDFYKNLLKKTRKNIEFFLKGTGDFGPKSPKINKNGQFWAFFSPFWLKSAILVQKMTIFWVIFLRFSQENALCKIYAKKAQFSNKKVLKKSSKLRK